MTAQQIPAAVASRLRADYSRAAGAADVARMTQQYAAGMFQAYQQRFAACLEMLGLNPKDKYWIDFETGLIHEGDPPEQRPQSMNGSGHDGAMQHALTDEHQ